MGVSPRPLDVHHGSEDLGIFIGSRVLDEMDMYKFI